MPHGPLYNIYIYIYTCIGLIHILGLYLRPSRAELHIGNEFSLSMHDPSLSSAASKASSHARQSQSSHKFSRMVYIWPGFSRSSPPRPVASAWAAGTSVLTVHQK